jgi:predicted nucleic acid-binding protein
VAAVLVDSNVLLDILIPDPHWQQWSSAALADAGENHVLVINPIIYSEVSTGFDRIEDLDEALSSDLFRRDPLPWEAAFLAAKSFLEYRRRGGAKRSPLPDFYIGAHAAVAGMALLTRDVARFKTYFPKVQLICPEE